MSPVPAVTVWPDPLRRDEHLRRSGAASACTLDELLESLAALAGARPLAPPALLLSLVAQSLVQAAEKGPWADPARDPELARAAGELFARHKLEGRPVEPGGALDSRQQLLARSFGRYQQALAAAGVGDEADLWMGARAGISALGPDWRGATRLEVRGLTELPALKRELLLELARRSCEGGPELELKIPSSGAWGADGPVDPLFAAFERQPELPPTCLVKEAPSALGRCELWACASPSDEARRLARRVRTLLGSGLHPDQLLLASPLPARDAPALRAALGEHGLTLRSPGARTLADGGLSRLMIGLGAAAEDQAPVGVMAQLLRRRLPPTLRRLGSWSLRQAGIRDDRLGAERGQGAYAARLQRLARRLQAQGRTSAADEVVAVGKEVERLLAILGGIPPRARFSHLLAAWRKALDALELAPEAGQPGDAAEAELLRALGEDLEAAWRTSGFGEVVGSPRELSRHLAAAAGQLPLDPPGTQAHGLLLVPLESAAGISASHLFLVGLDQGATAGPPSPWGEPSPRPAQQELAFAHLLLAARTAVASYAGTDRDGREWGPSELWERIAERGLGSLSPPEEAGLAIATEPELREAVLSASADDAPADVPAVLLAAAGLVEHEPWFSQARRRGEVERERRQSQATGRAAPHAGAIQDPGVRAALEERLRFDCDRPLSASRIGRYGNCRFQGFASHLLGLREREWPGEAQDPRSKGTFWHRILELLFRQLQERSLLGRPAEEIPEALIAAAISQAAEEADHALYLGHPALWNLALQRARTMVRRIFERQGGLSFEGLVPQHSEWTFGPDSQDEAWRQVVLPLRAGEPPVWLGGAIDRIDGNGQTLALIDYKSGKLEASKLAAKLLTSDFQLPFYVFAARSSGHTGPLRAAWLSLKNGEVIELAQALRGTSLEELLATDAPTRARLAENGKKNLANALQDLLSKLRQGDFAIDPQDCGGCGFRSVCRVRAQKDPEGPAGRAP